jgi:hypothetical protein
MAKVPMNPLAGPSGPSKYSTRTDKLSLGSTSYGDDTASLNTAAPKSKTRGVADDVGGRPANPVSQTPITPLFALSQRPEEAITSGVDISKGVGSSALMMQSQFAERRLSDVLAEMIPYDTTGEIQYLYQNALSRGN